MNGCMGGFGGMAPGELCEGLAQLKSEHLSLVKKLEGMLATAEKIENGEEPRLNLKELTLQTQTFMAELEPHSEREEGVLFEMMGQYIGRTSGPIAVMEYEHDRAKTLIGMFLARTGSEGAEFGDAEITELAGTIKEAYHTLTQHFGKEENVLFPMAQRMLSEEEKVELHRRIREI